MTELKIYQMLPRSYVGSYSGEKVHQFWHEQWIIALAKSYETCLMVSISDMPTIKYWKFLGSMMGKETEKIFLNNAELVIHVTRHWQLLEVINSQDTKIILFIYTKTVTVLCQ